MARVLLANDIAGYGKVATVAMLPVFAVTGIESVVLPTVILSSHTGGLPQVHVTDYTTGMAAFLSQWAGLDCEVDAVVTGYFKSPEQITMLEKYAVQSCPQAWRIVDPIMGDHGTLYSGFDERHVVALRQWCSQADVILPNLTEASLLLGRTYSDQLSDEALIQYCIDLAALGPKQVVLTGVARGADRIAVYSYDAIQQRCEKHEQDRVPGHFFGTGDLLTAAVSAGLLHGLPLAQAVDQAMAFVHAAVVDTALSGRDMKQGVFFERHLVPFAQQVFQKERDNHVH